MLSNMKVGTRLGLAFLLLTLLSVALGWIAIHETNAMKDQWREVKEVALAERNAANRGTIALSDGIHHFKNYILRGGDYATKFGADMSAIERTAEDYKSIGNLSAEEEKLLTQLREGAAAYRKDMETLVAMRAKTDDPHELDKAVAGADKPISAALANLTQLTEVALKHADEEMNEVSAAAQKKVIETLVVTVLLSIAAGVVISLSITRPIGAAVAVAETLARGELEIDIPAPSRDETGQLLAAMKRMIGSFKQVIDGQRSVVAAANRGDFEARIDMNGLQGFQKEMGEGLNTLMTTTGASISDVVRVMGAMSDGDLSQTVDKHYEGAFGQLKEYSNNTVVRLRQVIEGQRQVIAAANRGEFDARIDMSGLQGYQREMGEGLNNLISTTGASIDDVVRVMGAMSDGDLNNTIEKEYQGAFGELKEYCNNTVQRLAQVVSEVNRSA